MTALRNFTKSALAAGGFYRARLAVDQALVPGRRLIVLVYHNLHDPAHDPDPARPYWDLRPVLTVDLFERHLRVLRSTFPVVPLEEGMRRLSDSPEDREILAAITFDDGYLSFARLAAPALARYGMSATVFLPTKFIGAGEPFWWDELTRLLLLWNPDRITTLQVIEAAGCMGPMIPPLPGRNGLARKRAVLLAVERYWAQAPDAVHRQGLESLAALFDAPPGNLPEGLRTMSWDEVRCLHKEGIRFGAHTVTHANLAHAEPQGLEAEISTSVATVARELDSDVPTFAYPYGLDREAYARAVPALRKAGVRWARTMCYGYNSRTTDPWLLGRADLGAHPSDRLLTRDLLQSAREKTNA